MDANNLDQNNLHIISTYTGEIVKRTFQSKHKQSLKLCDSQVKLFWTNYQEKPVKQSFQITVADINSFRQPLEWLSVHSQNMIANPGTRCVNNLELDTHSSTWSYGFSWMKKDKGCFPAETIKWNKAQ